MTDRELLELAAKAAGYEFRFSRDWHDKGEPQIKAGGWNLWNPLTDDGDALGLSVKLRLNLSHSLFSVTAWTSGAEIDLGVSSPELVDEESRREKATRRAIVRAAAAIASEAKP